MEQDRLKKQIGLLQGTPDPLILKAASLEPPHGYGLLLCIPRLSSKGWIIQQGSLYPALRRLEHQRTIAGERRERASHRKAKHSRLTHISRGRLAGEAQLWNHMAGIIGNIPRTTPEVA